MKVIIIEVVLAFKKESQAQPDAWWFRSQTKSEMGICLCLFNRELSAKGIS